jgi:carboxyl-terminal processing protease
MRVVSAWCLALSAAALCAAPVTPPDFARSPASPDHALRSEALNYARNLVTLVDRIEEAYVRPVSRADLYEAALVGLYEAAREPVPDGLRAEVRQAVHSGVVDLREINDLLTGTRAMVSQYYDVEPTGVIAQAILVMFYRNAYEAVPNHWQTRLPPLSKGDITPLLARIRENLGQPDVLRGPKALIVSLEALPRVLDPYCGLTPRQEFQRLDQNDGMLNTGLEFVGVPLPPVRPAVVPGRIRGDVTNISTDEASPHPAGPLRVARVQPGSPAQRAGIRPGDMIVRINDEPPESPRFAALVQRLRPVPIGTPNAESPQRLTIVRPGRTDPIRVPVALSDYQVETVFGARRKSDGAWDYMLDPVQRIGYVRLDGIRNHVGHLPDGESYGSDRELSDALHSLRASNVRGLILDLRWCPGGMLNEARNIARLFLPEQLPRTMPLYWQRDRDGRQIAVPGGPVNEPFLGVPMVVLVNGETSGGGELIAAALQDHGRVVVAGQRTVGKATIQTPEPVPGIQFKLTTGTFLRPNGKNLQRFPDSRPADDWGVRPDQGRELPLTAEAGRRLKQWWTLQTLRPPETTEALPLDDPENDPQRLAAVQMVLGLIKK